MVNHPARKAFLLLPWFWRTWERLCLNQEQSLLSLHWMFLGYIFEHRTNSHALGVVGSVITIAVSINGCYSRKSHNAVWREKTRLTSPEVWAAVTSMAWRDSGRASFSTFSFKKTKGSCARRVVANRIANYINWHKWCPQNLPLPHVTWNKISWQKNYGACMKYLKIMYFHWALISAFMYFKYSPPSLWEQTPFLAVVSLGGWKFEINAGGN